MLVSSHMIVCFLGSVLEYSDCLRFDCLICSLADGHSSC